MFRTEYKLTHVNRRKGIVTLAPTKKTWLQAFLPSLVFGAATMAISIVLESMSEPTPLNLDRSSWTD